jgi:hypothetical protein
MEMNAGIADNGNGSPSVECVLGASKPPIFRKSLKTVKTVKLGTLISEDIRPETDRCPLEDAELQIIQGFSQLAVKRQVKLFSIPRANRGVKAAIMHPASGVKAIEDSVCEMNARGRNPRP